MECHWKGQLFYYSEGKAASIKIRSWAEINSKQTPALSHIADFAYGPLFAILAEFQNSMIPSEVFTKLSKFSGEHTFTSSAFSPPFDIYPRNITAWLAPNISIGAETFNETVVGGPATNPQTFNPAVIQWDTGNGIGWCNAGSTPHSIFTILIAIQLFATESYITAAASANTLNLTYPLGDANSIFSFIVSPFKAKKDVASWDDVQGLSVHVSGNVNMSYTIGYAGAYGGAYSVIK